MFCLGNTTIYFLIPDLFRNIFLSSSLQITSLSSSVFYCTKLESEQQGRAYQKELSQNPRWSACYIEDYVIQLYLADLGTVRERRKLLFDIGANKGYTIATWFSLWNPQSQINPRSLANYLRKNLSISQCGECNDCLQMSLSTKVKVSLDMNIEIYAFEPQPSTYEILRQVKQWTNQRSLHIYNLAMSNQTGTELLLKCNPGDEFCGLETSKSARNIERYLLVNVTTLDTFLQRSHITEMIDVLKIDTEGHDPLVLKGAELTLKQQQVRLLIFEHHEVGLWKYIHLRDVIENLDLKGYTCYMFGRTGLIRITRCWSSILNKKRWSNVLCVVRNDGRLQHIINKLIIPHTL
ncbi:unnamed protein product [Adineta ricciae]|uniref:Methyltransferase FkbM domain-containing protein n=1 Tax=Adineta ricciae TaxID=249248 RepID=A0A816B6Y6_ADIRI|nr:unnamed protein product [Adineta ricciae]CAF1604498.1 unnamed protein product [Adineta ricciae]